MTLVLSSVSTGQSGQVQEVRGNKAFAARAGALGFTQGAEVQVLQNDGHGPILVNIRHTRLAISRSDAFNIKVVVA